VAKKTLTLRIKPTAEALEEFKDTFTKVATGRRVQRREGVYFTSIEAARNLLTRNRLALLRAIRTLRPRSTYDLAQRVGRDVKNVQEDLRLLEEYGLVRLGETRGAGKRRTKVPEVLFGEIALKIAI
jgi:predicted transcriptional regulator